MLLCRCVSARRRAVAALRGAVLPGLSIATTSSEEGHTETQPRGKDAIATAQDRDSKPGPGAVGEHTAGTSLGTAHGHGPSASAAGHQPTTSQLLRFIQNKIMMRGGPLSVAEYMQDALTSPHGGFYMTRDVFGAAGDFVTSPEISQMFGEMVGAWVVHTWDGMGRPDRIALVELGPGRGTLLADLLRVTAGFKAFRAALDLHLVEVSPALRALQWQALRMRGPAFDPATGPVSGTCGWTGAQVTWHHALESVPRGPPALFIAHEFFDALPVHQFVKDPVRGWVEKLVDVVEGSEAAAEGGEGQESTGAVVSPTGPRLRFVLSPSPTPASTLLVQRRLAGMAPERAAACTELEVSAHGMAAAEALALRVGQHGGAALVIDYGRDSPYTDSVVAIRAHQGVGVLDEPGTADLSAWVDFSALRQAALGSGAPVSVHGPVSQASFLLQMGIQHRLQRLLQTATDATQAEQLVSGYRRLVDGEGSDGGMGRNYQVMAITHSSQPTPAAFILPTPGEHKGQDAA